MNFTSKINKLVLGTVQFGLEYGVSNTLGKTKITEAFEILNSCRNFKINQLDTASAYGDSEMILGRLNIDDFKITTKFISKNKINELEQSLNTSLTNLNVKKIFSFIAHRPIEIIENEQLWNYLNKKKSDNIIENIGISVNTLEELEIFLQKGFYPDIVQLPYNFLDRRFENISINLKKKNIKVYARSPFLQGLFFIDRNRINNKYSTFKNYLSKFSNKNNNLAATLLNFVLEKKFIDHVVFGVNSKNQLLELVSDLKNSNFVHLPEFEKFDDNIITPSEWKELIVN